MAFSQSVTVAKQGRSPSAWLRQNQAGDRGAIVILLKPDGEQREGLGCR